MLSNCLFLSTLSVNCFSLSVKIYYNSLSGSFIMVNFLLNMFWKLCLVCVLKAPIVMFYWFPDYFFSYRWLFVTKTYSFFKALMGVLNKSLVLLLLKETLSKKLVFLIGT
jgi:hypothetical protein